MRAFDAYVIAVRLFSVLSLLDNPHFARLRHVAPNFQAAAVPKFSLTLCHGLPLPADTPKGVHVGIHCFRHGVTTELLEQGVPIHVVTRLMRHGDSKVTLDHYAHIIGDAERVASERLSSKIGAQLESGSELESTKARTA